MKLFSALRHPMLAVLPALLLASACSDDDKPVTPTVEHGRVNAYHMAASANVNLKFLVDDNEKGNVVYGQNIGYQTLEVGSRVLKVNVASTNSTVLTQNLTVEKDRNYSFFAYATAPTTLGGLLVTDDLTTPTSGKAKVRFVNLGEGTPSPLKLSTTVAAVADIPNTETVFGAASPFVEILPGSYNIAVTSGAASTTVTNGNVGDGSGSGTVANKNYEAGKIYTVVYRGITGPLVDASLQPKAVVRL